MQINFLPFKYLDCAYAIHIVIIICQCWENIQKYHDSYAHE